MWRIHVEIHGRVQGVGFRWFVREHARRLDLSGWVRNLPSGAVEVEAAGESRAISTFRDSLGQGPSSAVVERVAELPCGDAELPHPFTVLR